MRPTFLLGQVVGDGMNPTMVGNGRQEMRFELRALTGFRGLAATTIALAHFQKFYPTYLNAPFMWHNAVDLFFCLSGFTLSYVYRPESFKFSSYLTARVARIYPLYLATLLIAGATIAWPAVDQTAYPARNAFSDFVLQIPALNSWPIIGSGVHWDPPAWSISVEWLCYLLLFPLLLVQRAPSSTPIRLLCIVVLSSISYSLFVRYFDSNVMLPQRYQAQTQWSYWVNSLRGAFGFTAGWLVFRCFEKRDGIYVFCARFHWLIWCSMGLIVAFAYCDHINPQALVFLFPFAVLAATDQTSASSRLLGSKGLHFLGVISYSIYMTHFVVFVCLLDAFGPPATWTISIYAAAIILAAAVFTISYFMIEKPARDAIRAQRPIRPLRPE
ncbi:acyltransferase family protein [Bradyrhizobium sp. USDA 4502]